MVAALNGKPAGAARRKPLKKPGRLAKGRKASLGLPVGRAASMGVDLKSILAGVKRLRTQVDEKQMPGFLSCVIKEGKLLHLEAYGMSDLGGDKQCAPDTLFRLYSQTKPIVVVAFLKLLERGLVALEEPLSKFIPAFAKTPVGAKGVPLKRAITLRDLLAHTSGIGFGPGFGYPAENDYESTYVDLVDRVDRQRIKTLAQWCEELAKLPLRFQPGRDWGYGYSSDVLGRVVEVAAGKALDKVLQEEVLGPLGMTDTFFAVPSSKASRLAALYKREPWDGSGKNVKFITVDAGCSGKTVNASRNTFDRCSDGTGPTAPSASVFLAKGGHAFKVLQGGGCVCSVAGGLVSCLKDYARFGQMLVNDGELEGTRLLRPETVELLRKDWLNEFTEEKRKEPLWLWGDVGVGFSPIGQIGVPYKGASRHKAGSALDTIHWGGAGGSGYMLNWPHRVVVLTYSGCTFDTSTQKTMWKATLGALRNGRAKPLLRAPRGRR
eukprot:TRINITY_DN36785_c0_g1_i1.p1 TRINITY_DN36785_c0_g1~~TRINITY_DN36785_c0_g1_i1.p1  ORF type:complete len:493 (+),score=128.79 TRINITY_DN36785_c0_g1_i1:67-1545(+)